MFLDSLIRRNRRFVEAAIFLHQEGKIPANSCVLDLDAIRDNSALFAREAQRLGLKTLAMTKQLGRNPAALGAMVQGGIDSFVAVDMDGARTIRDAGYHVGHIGHLVQIARHENREAAALDADYWTVFSDTKAQEAAAAAHSLEKTQALLARIQTGGDIFYMGHEGGFPAEEVVAVAERLDALEGARFAGITTFPALLFDEESGAVEATPNLKTLEKAAEALRRAGIEDLEINAPGTTSSVVLQALADAGATQVEPGNGLAGTTPLHAVETLPEAPAILYLSEISHEYNGKAYCFGGGLYIDPVFEPYQVQALVGRDGEALDNRLDATLPPPSAIDYYSILEPQPSRPVEPGETVIFGFRQQVFVTRALVAPIAGVSEGEPSVEGIWTAMGAPWSGTMTGRGENNG